VREGGKREEGRRFRVFRLRERRGRGGGRRELRGRRPH